MKKFIVRIIIFFSLIFVIDIGYGILFDYLKVQARSGDDKRFRDLCNQGKYDVVIMGSSRAHHHYKPQLFVERLGLDCYNAGCDGQGVVFFTGLVKLLTGEFTPKFIIYDVEPTFDIYKYDLDYNNTRYLTYLRPYYRDPQISRIFKDLSYFEYLKVNSGLYRHNGTSLQTIINLFKENSAGDGFEPLYGEMGINHSKHTKREMVYDQFKLKCLNELVEHLSSKGIYVIFVASPKYGASEMNFFNNIQALAKDYSNVEFLNFYAHPAFVDKSDLFKDPMHLNSKGAEVFTNMVIDTLSYYNGVNVKNR